MLGPFVKAQFLQHLENAVSRHFLTRGPQRQL